MPTLEEVSRITRETRKAYFPKLGKVEGRMALAAMLRVTTRAIGYWEAGTIVPHQGNWVRLQNLHRGRPK